MSRSIPRSVTVIRWFARIWSILVFIIVLMMVIAPEPNTKPVPLSDLILLSFYGVSAFGLLIAWRWEGPGGAIAIAAIVTQGIGFLIVNGFSLESLKPLPVGLIVFVLPGTLFLICWAFSRRDRESSQKSEKEQTA